MKKIHIQLPEGLHYLEDCEWLESEIYKYGTCILNNHVTGQGRRAYALEVEASGGFFHAHRRMLAIVLRPEETALFGRGKKEDDAASGGYGELFELFCQKQLKKASRMLPNSICPDYLK